MLESGRLLTVRNLKKHFPVRRGVLGRIAGYVKAVDGVSFTLRRGATLGLVGESGCGKTTLGRTVLRLLEPTSGNIIFDGAAVEVLPGWMLRPMRRRMQIIFQDPYSSLNPRMTVQDIVGEPLKVHGVARGRERRALVRDLLEQVGLARAYVNHYPHEFSGGQRQRIGIARAIALNPDLIVCDEPVSALDVSVQAQIINLLADLQEQRGLSYLFISHDLGVVEHISHDVAVMYMGRIVEMAPREELYSEPLHPYTRLLLAAIPSPDPQQASARRRPEAERGGPPPRAGCPFYPRCPVAEAACAEVVPELGEAKPGHFVSCIQA